MTRAKQMEDKRLMTFEELYNRRQAGRLTADDAAEILGVSTRTFRRWRARFEDEGEEGLYDRRLDRISSNKVPVDETMKVLELFETEYFDYSVRHFHDALVADHGFTRSYNWLRLKLQSSGLVRPAPRRGAHRRKRPRRPLPGMMLHQDASRHSWVPGVQWDLVVTMDDATSEIFSARFVEEEGTMSTFQGLEETISSKGLFCSLYVDRGSHYWHTPEAGGKVDKGNPTQVGRALRDLGIEMIAAYSPQARGRSERMFGTLQNRLPQELRQNEITTMEAANRFLRESYLPKHNARFSRQAEGEGTAFVPFHGDLSEHLCVQVDRLVRNDNTVSYKGRTLQISENRHRHHYVRVNVRIREYPDERLAVFHGPRCIGRYESSGAALPAEA